MSVPGLMSAGSFPAAQHPRYTREHESRGPPMLIVMKAHASEDKWSAYAKRLNHWASRPMPCPEPSRTADWCNWHQMEVETGTFRRKWKACRRRSAPRSHNNLSAADLKEKTRWRAGSTRTNWSGGDEVVVIAAARHRTAQQVSRPLMWPARALDFCGGGARSA